MNGVVEEGADLGVSVVHFILLDHGATLVGAVVHDHIQLRPRLKLTLPVGDGGEGHDDEEGTSHAIAHHLLDEGERLDGLAKTHLVSQDAALAVAVGEGEPVETLELVLAQGVLVEVIGTRAMRVPILRTRSRLRLWWWCGRSMFGARMLGKRVNENE